MPDLTEIDLTETVGTVLEQSLLSVPFFVTHRLFILKSPFLAPKSVQEKLVELLPRLAPTTVAVLFEPNQADGRTKLWQWLKINAIVYTHNLPTGSQAIHLIQGMAQKWGVMITADIAQQLITSDRVDTWYLENEIAKLAAFVKSRRQSEITKETLQQFGSSTSDPSVFLLTDAIRDGKLVESIGLVKQLELVADPMATAGMVATVVRNLTKIVLAGTNLATSVLAQKTGLHPYVVTLSLPAAKKQSIKSLKRCYQDLVRFETDVKQGRLPGSLALVLLILRLNDNLK